MRIGFRIERRPGPYQPWSSWLPVEPAERHQGRLRLPVAWELGSEDDAPLTHRLGRVARSFRINGPLCLRGGGREALLDVLLLLPAEPSREVAAIARRVADVQIAAGV